jgi:hypothetical protein
MKSNTNILAGAALVALLAASGARADIVSLGTAIIANELPKCANGVGVAGGCVGPNGVIVKAIRNGVSDLTHGPGDHNDLVGRHGFVRGILGF